MGFPMMLVGLIYARYIGKQIYQIPSEDGEGFVRLNGSQAITHYEDDKDDEKLPSTFMSFAPIVVPIILILIQTISAVLKVKGAASYVINFLGSPVIAVGIGLIIAIYGLTGKVDRKEVINQMENGIKAAGIIILVTGGGGARADRKRLCSQYGVLRMRDPLGSRR
jgi:GntP family gluconate:H+ symporter